MKHQNLHKTLTVNFLIVLIGILFFLPYTNPCAAQNKKPAETYKTFIKQADQAFAAQDYKGALLLYEKAKEAKPEYNYATDKIDEITKILDAGTDSKAQSTKNNNGNSAYKTIIAKADYALADKEYADALLLYEKAYQTRPDYNYATEKIDEIHSILNSTPDTKAQILKNTILKADSLYERKNYQLAKSEYEKASLIDSSAQLPKARLQQISSYYVDPNDMTNFNLAISSGDKELAMSEFDNAILYYEAALELHPSSKFVNKKIAEAKKQQTDYKVKTGQPTINIASADKPIKSEKPVEARAENKKSVAIAPVDQNVKEKTKEPDNNINANKTTPDNSDKSFEQDKSQLQLTQLKYDTALASAEKLLKTADYEGALIGFKSALAIKPAESYPKVKIADIEKLLAENTSRKEAYDIAIKNGDQSLNENKYDIALNHYRNALSLLPGEKYPSQKIEEITAITEKQKESDENYRKFVAEANKQFNENKFEDAISSYSKALEFKPSETYPQQKITEAQSKLAASKSEDKDYASAIASGDHLLSETKYNEALNAYKQALSIKPNEAYPTAKTVEINIILAKQKSESENYSQAVRTGDKALAAGDYNLALTSFQDARKIKPSEQYPQEQIIAIKALVASQQKKDEKYTTAINTGDQLFAVKEYNKALTAYTEAAELKRNEKYPEDQISIINKILIDSSSVDDNYTLAIAEGDKFFEIKDYAESKSAFVKATGLKPAETYPRQRIVEINKIVEEKALAHSNEYNNAIKDADKLYNTKVFDKAIDAYEAAAKINPGDAYPELQIGKIRKYMSDHAILNLYSQALIINKGNEKKFTFSAIDPSLRKNNYILLKARSTGNTTPKVYLNYGKDDQKNGGIVLRNLDKSTISDFLISISIQDKWFREENNWISISVETGDIEITKVQIAAGE